MTYEQAIAFARLDSFRYVQAQDDGTYAVVMTCLMWVSANVELYARTCTTQTQVISLESSNRRMIQEFDRSRHSIKRRAAAEGIRKLAHHKARYADRRVVQYDHGTMASPAFQAVSA